MKNVYQNDIVYEVGRTLKQKIILFKSEAHIFGCDAMGCKSSSWQQKEMDKLLFRADKAKRSLEFLYQREMNCVYTSALRSARISTIETYLSALSTNANATTNKTFSKIHHLYMLDRTEHWIHTFEIWVSIFIKKKILLTWTDFSGRFIIWNVLLSCFSQLFILSAWLIHCLEIRDFQRWYEYIFTSPFTAAFL